MHFWQSSMRQTGHESEAAHGRAAHDTPPKCEGAAAGATPLAAAGVVACSPGVVYRCAFAAGGSHIAHASSPVPPGRLTPIS
jgi:hypothetical protein